MKLQVEAPQLEDLRRNAARDLVVAAVIVAVGLFALASAIRFAATQVRGRPS